MKLCKFSQSEILAADILAVCPLDLTQAESKACPCKTRKYHVPPADLRVLACEFPNDWRGQPIRSVDALRRSLKNGKDKPVTTPNDQPQPQPQTANLPVPTTSKPTGLSVYSRIRDPLEFAKIMGPVIYQSKMFGCSNVDQGRILAFQFMVKGIDPFEFRSRHHIIGGNVTMSAEAMLADFRTVCGGSHKIIARTPDRAAVELTIGKSKQLFDFTLTDAMAEDYIYTSDAVKGSVPKQLPSGALNPAALKDNWSTPRRRMQMLWARVISDAVGAMAPEVSSGKCTPEELGVYQGDIQSEIVDAEFVVTQADVPCVSTNAETPAATALAAPSTTSPAPTVDEKREMLLELKALKSELLSPEQYRKVLDSKGVRSALELDLGQLAHMVHGLRIRKEKAAVKAGTDPLSQWANQQVAGGAQVNPT